MKKIMGIAAALFIAVAVYAQPPRPVKSVNKPVTGVESVQKDDKPKPQNKFKKKQKLFSAKYGLKKRSFKNPR